MRRGHHLAGIEGRLRTNQRRNSKDFVSIRNKIGMMNRGSDSILKGKDIEVFAKPRPKKKRLLKKSPAPLR
jgi:hypothetical protein